MKIAIVGAGYVGAVTGACLASMGHKVILVDREASKVERLKEGKSPISEPGLNELLQKVTSEGFLSATINLEFAASDADLVLISVGTPTNEIDGSADLQAIKRVFAEISQVIKGRASRISIAITSTVPPGTTNEVARKIILKSGVREEDFNLAFIPEFLREGTAIGDFLNPSRFILGVDNQDDADPFLLLRPDLIDRTHIVGIKEAEMLKTVENAWHATKIVFANEVGRISQSLNVDGREVMKLLSLDTRQNISKTYLRPGFAFGGSCLPKDVRSIVRLGELRAVSTPLLGSLIPSNQAQVEAALSKIISIGVNSIGILGIAFKADTDDIRESPGLELIQRLLGKGYNLKVHDFEALNHELYGSNLATFERHANIRSILVTNLQELIDHSKLIVLTQYNKKYLGILNELPRNKLVIDLTGLVESTESR